MTAPLTTFCLFCRRVLINGEWVKDPHPDRFEHVSHVTCPECVAAGAWEESMNEQPPQGENREQDQ